jgi:ribosomal subunit interface protein
MRIDFTSRGIRVSSSVRTMARERLERVARRLPSAKEAHVVLGREKDRRYAEIVLRGKGKTFKVKEETGDVRLALAAAADNLDRAVRRYVDRKIGRRRRDMRAKRRPAAPETQPADEEKRAAPKTTVRKFSNARTDAAPLA